ncbi:hypothetical protein ABW19_dt0200267 [Dactylella cylindrospora]|nr:hypothetical protein ABW19_dt0200267 [Dactylella cylindrospora]
MLIPPLDVLLTWPKPNYINPDRQGDFMAPIIIVMTVICAIVVALRLYVRAFILKAFKADDWLIIFAFITAVGVSVTCILSEPAGVGLHAWDLTSEQAKQVHIWSFATQLTFTWSVSLTKISILLFYLRFCTTRSFKWWIYGSMIFLAAWVTAWTFLVTFQCVPVQAYWRPGPPHKSDKCILIQNEMHLLHGSTNLVTDVLVLLLPIPTILKLQMPTRQKFSLIAVFTLGIVAPLSAILRLVYIQKATLSWDASWWCLELWIYTCLETHVAIVCASIPSLKPLIVKIFPHFGSSQVYADGTPMANSGASGGSGLRTHSRSGSHAKSGTSSRAERANKSRSIYPLTSIVAIDDRGESQESIVAKAGNTGFSGSTTSDVVTSFGSGSPPRVPPREGTVVKTTEINITSTWGGKGYGDDRRV